MKQIITVIAILALYSCKAQTIVPIKDLPVDEEPSFAYFKDTENDFNKFEGTWKWESGNNSLTIVLKKVEQHNLISNDLYDFLVGEYQYIENGVVQNNSLPFNLNTTEPYDHNIKGSNITDKHAPPCNECEPGTRFVKLNLKEPENPQLEGEVTMGHFIENGTEKLKVRIYNTDLNIQVASSEYTGPTDLKIPENTIYTLVKQ